MRLRGVALALFSLTVLERAGSPTESPIAPAPLPRRGPIGEWTRRSAKLSAFEVRLNGLGMRTHANWIFFRLPFETTDGTRIRNVGFWPSASRPTAVGALRFGGVCVTMPSSGDVAQWTMYTRSGVAWSDPFAWHPAAPTMDPTVLGINVPTRVANHVACGRDPALLDPSTWTLEVAWEER